MARSESGCSRHFDKHINHRRGMQRKTIATHETASGLGVVLKSKNATAHPLVFAQNAPTNFLLFRIRGSRLDPLKPGKSC